MTTAKDLTIVADGKDHKVSAAVGTAKEALTESGVKLKKDDFLSVPMSASLSDGQVLTVNRVENKTVKDEQAIKAKVETKKSDSLYQGETKVESEGKDGQKQVVYKVKTINGEQVKKEKKDEKVLSEPKTKVVIQGTKKKETPADTGGSDSGSSDSGGSDSGDSSTGGGDSGSTGGSMSTAEIKAMLGGPGSKWYSIVECESNFNPKASNGTHFGLFQFLPSTWQSMGGSGNPSDASPQEQFQRAKKLQAQEGWSQWQCS